MKRVKAWLIRLLGGERKVYVTRVRTEYRSHGRPFEMSDWERLASMDAYAPEFFRYLDFRLKALDKKEAAIPLSPDRDRERLEVDVQRRIINELLELPGTALERVTRAMTELQGIDRQKGLTNHGK